jgi:hypothetical protein
MGGIANFKGARLVYSSCTGRPDIYSLELIVPSTSVFFKAKPSFSIGDDSSFVTTYWCSFYATLNTLEPKLV